MRRRPYLIIAGLVGALVFSSDVAAFQLLCNVSSQYQQMQKLRKVSPCKQPISGSYGVSSDIYASHTAYTQHSLLCLAAFSRHFSPAAAQALLLLLLLQSLDGLQLQAVRPGCAWQHSRPPSPPPSPASLQQQQPQPSLM
jgi:hypothetical protein